VRADRSRPTRHSADVERLAATLNPPSRAHVGGEARDATGVDRAGRGALAVTIRVPAWA
jgi:hypothetical protein